MTLKCFNDIDAETTYKMKGNIMDALRTGEVYTIQNIYDLPDGERAELIDGEIYYMAAPSRSHQRISGYLYSQIYNYIFANKVFFWRGYTSWHI